MLFVGVKNLYTAILCQVHGKPVLSQMPVGH